MYKMNDACQELNIKYETLKYYCNIGLVPDLKRDKNNYRIFSEDDINWLKGVIMLRKCGMSITDIKKYLEYFELGQEGIFYQEEMLNNTLNELNNKKEEIGHSIEYIKGKQKYYNDIKSGKIEYMSTKLDK